VNTANINTKKNKNNRKRDNIFKNADIYVVRVYFGDKKKENNNNEIVTSMSKPCKHCIAFLKSIGIKRVFYTTGDIYNNEWKCEKLSEIESTHISSGNRNHNKYK